MERRHERGYLSLVVDDVETFDMLVGRLQREGEVTTGEEVTFVCGETLCDNSRAFPRIQFEIFQAPSSRISRQKNYAGTDYLFSLLSVML